jgi:hypothetical protein
LEVGHTQTHVGGGAATYIFTESSESDEGGGAVRQRLEVSTSCKREGGGAVRRQLELPTSWREGGGAVQLGGEENLL